jgi:chitinase
VLVYLTADTIVEGNETFDVTLSSPVNVTIGDGTGTVTIVDDD